MTTDNIYNPYTTVPNQLFGKIHKPKYKKEGIKFMYIGINEIREAAINLTPSALKLYLYFAENEDEWQFNLSPKNFQKVYGVAESTYRKAKQELVDKGYIVEKEHNHFEFYTSPAEARISFSELREELTWVAGAIRDRDIEVYNKYNAECAKIKEITNMEEKKKVGLDLLRRMKDELARMRKKNHDFYI